MEKLDRLAMLQEELRKAFARMQQGEWVNAAYLDAIRSEIQTLQKPYSPERRH